MHVHLYSGCISLVRRSGVGQAVLHQQQMLDRVGIETTSHWSEPAEAIHLNTIFPDSLLAGLLAHGEGRKVVYYGHSTMEDFQNSFRGSNTLAPLFRRWIVHCYNCGDVIITPTEYSKGVLESYGIRKPIYSLSNGIDTEFFAPSEEHRAAFRRKYGLSPEEKAVLSVGHYIERKGLPDFVELARRLPQVRFFWFGYTNPNLVPENIRSAIRNAPENLCFPGYVDRGELRDAYCGCDLFAFLSKEETEGIVVLEALSCGISTVVRDIPVYRDWLENGVNVYKASDTYGFEETIRELLSGGLPDVTEAGRRVAQARNLSAVGERLREIYRREQILS